MPGPNVQTHLLRARGELERVCENTTISEEERLMGFVEQLRYVTEGSQLEPEPEALVAPDPDALDTMYERLIELIEQTDDDDARVCLRRACNDLGIAITVLKGRRERQHGVGVGSEEIRPNQP